MQRGQLTRHCVPQAPGCKTWRDYRSFNEKSAFSCGRRSRTPSYRAFKPGSRPLLNCGLPGEAIWCPCQSLEVVYIQGWSVAGEGGMFTSLFTFTPRGKGFIYSQENVFNRVLPPPSTRRWRTRIIPPNSDPISISPTTFFGAPRTVRGVLAVGRGLHHC